MFFNLFIRYCDPMYDFPRQIDAINDVILIVKRHLEIHPKTLIVCGSYSIGKERVFINLVSTYTYVLRRASNKCRVIEYFEILHAFYSFFLGRRVGIKSILFN